VAALLPSRWEVRLVDRNVEELEQRDLAWADVVMIGGMLPQQRDALALVERARRAGKPVVVGGPDVTSSPEVYRAADFRVLGEAEEVLARFAADWEAGVRSGTYEAGGFPDLTRSPVPRFDLLRLDRYMHVGVQFSRGCPFDCEFCNVIELNGRRPRAKTVEQVIRELDALLAVGYRGHVDFVDDNFIGPRRAARPLLTALSGWLARNRHPFEFTTEASLDLADDPELLRLMVAAGFFAVFVGLETPDTAALAEAHKVQNVRRDIVASVQRIQRAGIFVNAGFIIGFDAERDSMSRAMVACIEGADIAVCMVGLLYALPGTRLARRLAGEGRLAEDAHAVGTGDADQCTSGLNFRTRRPRGEMLADYRAVLADVYAPEAFFGRVRRVSRSLDRSRHRLRQPLGHVARDVRSFARIAARLGVREAGARRAFWGAMADCLVHNPRAFKIAASLAALYLHLGPYARRAVARLDGEIAGETAGDLPREVGPRFTRRRGGAIIGPPESEEIPCLSSSSPPGRPGPGRRRSSARSSPR
jgi:radical SAM superfamily enzyme YgiQ (UPF0313 family)